MCGITGWVSFDRALETQQDIVRAMTDTMACRGPDDSGVWINRHVAFGHRRLAIIDLAGGAQPMTVDTPRGVVSMTYSGEAYNYRELRQELAGRGHRFRTDSDTEVVLHAYLEWGEAMAERLVGMYALAIWDSAHDRLVLLRDRMGVKPLYYAQTPDGLVFGSEPKAILANPLVLPAVDLTGLRELFSASKTPGHAVWSGMAEVEPGTMVVLDRMALRRRTYWKLEVGEHTDDLDTTVATIRGLLDDSVTGQLVSDVPRCSLLSGGLDSSAVTALSTRHLATSGERLRTFTVDFAGQSENFTPDGLRDTPDAPYVRDVAKHLDIEHSGIILSAEHLADPENRRKTMAAKDLPIGVGEMDISLYLLFKAIREHSTVALSGEAADESFGGYAWFHMPALANATTFPWVAALTGDPTGRDRNRGLENTAASFLTEDLKTSLDSMNYIADHYSTAMAEVPHPAGPEDPAERRMREVTYLHLTRFMRTLLDRKDRLSMAVGLEVRVPFCDHRLVQYLFNVPWSMKTFDGREKSLLRAAVADLLPASVLDRVKSPYPSTQDPRYTAALREQVRALVAETQNPVFDLFDRAKLGAAARSGEALPMRERLAFEWLLDASIWLEQRRPTLKIS